MRKKLGRKVNPNSIHRVIAEAASYLIDCDGIKPSVAVTEACRRASEAVGDERCVDPANVRKALRELRRPRTVRCEYTGAVGPWAAVMPDAVDVPFLHSVDDVGIESPAGRGGHAQE